MDEETEDRRVFRYPLREVISDEVSMSAFLGFQRHAPHPDRTPDQARWLSGSEAAKSGAIRQDRKCRAGEPVPRTPGERRRITIIIANDGTDPISLGTARLAYAGLPRNEGQHFVASGQEFALSY